MILAMSIVSVSSAPVTIAVLDVKRHITIGEWGAVVFNDTFTILNNGTSSVEEFLYAVPRSNAEGLRFIVAKSSSGSLKVERDVDKESPFYWMRIHLKDPLPQGRNLTVNVASIHSDMVSFLKFEGMQGTEELYRVSFSAYPILKTRARSCNVTVYVSWDAKFQLPYNASFIASKIEGKPVLVASRKPLDPLTDERYSFNFSSTTQHLVTCDWARREISISPGGEISVSERYRLNNLASSASSIRMILPKETVEVMAYDDAGPLWTDRKKTFDVTIAPRFRTVRENESFTFGLEYKLSAKQSLKQLQWWGLYNLTLKLMTDSPWVIEKAEVRIVLPRGVSVESNSIVPASRTDSSSYETVLSYLFEPATPLHDMTLDMRYRYLPFWSGLIPLMWVLLIQVIITGVVAVSRLRKPAQPLVIAPVDRIMEFVELHDEKTALSLELDKMEQDMARGAISRHEYRRRSREIDRRIEEMRKELQLVKTALSAASARYGEMIRRIERAEAEIDAAKASMAQLRTQYRTGKMARHVYDGMVSDVTKRQDRARETMNSIIITLREEAR